MISRLALRRLARPAALIAALAACAHAPASSARTPASIVPTRAAGDTLRTPSGIRYVLLRSGSGPALQDDDYVLMHYTLWLSGADSIIESSRRDGAKPLGFLAGAGGVIPGFEEGARLLGVGGRGVFVLPPELAYGAKGSPPMIPPNATLVFDEEVVGIDTNSVAKLVRRSIPTLGADSTVALVRALAARGFAGYRYREGSLRGVANPLAKQRRFPEALAVARLDSALAPRSADVQEWLATVYLRSADTTRAIAGFTRALELTPARGAADRRDAEALRARIASLRAPGTSAP